MADRSMARARDSWSQHWQRYEMLINIVNLDAPERYELDDTIDYIVEQRQSMTDRQRHLVGLLRHMSRADMTFLKDFLVDEVLAEYESGVLNTWAPFLFTSSDEALLGIRTQLLRAEGRFPDIAYRWFRDRIRLSSVDAIIECIRDLCEDRSRTDALAYIINRYSEDHATLLTTAVDEAESRADGGDVYYEDVIMETLTQIDRSEVHALADVMVQFTQSQYLSTLLEEDGDDVIRAILFAIDFINCVTTRQDLVRPPSPPDDGKLAMRAGRVESPTSVITDSRLFTSDEEPFMVIRANTFI